MAGFDTPLETWNARFAREDFLFGEEPNAFLRAQAHWLRPADSILCVADGEGRNSVWLAEQGYTVTTFDFAPNAVAKARGLAQRRNVNVRHELGDAYTWPWAVERFDALVAAFIQFLPPSHANTGMLFKVYSKWIDGPDNERERANRTSRIRGVGDAK